MSANDFFDVHSYSLDNFKNALADVGDAQPALVSSKSHVHYLHDYLEHEKVKTIVVEKQYVDRDYLEDFAGYYVRCFNDDAYGPRCHRLHFFDSSFDAEAFNAVLCRSQSAMSLEDLQSAYIGFLVVKPLPATFIGRTCLRPYHDLPERHYPITHQYKASLFGIPLKVESLAFQEQDKVIAACATSALWSAFHATGSLFQHSIPSPLEITKAATEKVPSTIRTMPNKGLTGPMMTHAIRHVGLDPYPIDQKGDENFHLLKSTLYAYLNAGIPVIAGVQLYKKNVSEGFHAVTVAGYRLDLDRPISYGQTGFLLRASRISKIYVHDDQVGPFAKMTFNKSFLHTELALDGHVGKKFAEPAILLIPLYHKIRIPFITIQTTIIAFDAVFKRIFKILNQHLELQIEWDISLTTISEYKAGLLKDGINNTAELRDTLLMPFPRWIWRATAYINDQKDVDLLFDATNIEQGDYFIHGVNYVGAIYTILRALKGVPGIQEMVETDLSDIRPILKYFFS